MDSNNFPLFLGAGGALLMIALLVWSGIWKAIALWKAARNNQLGWYIALLLINTVGLLEIVYILAFSKKTEPVTPATPPSAS